MRRSHLPIALLAISLLAAACSSEPAEVRRAHAVLAGKSAENPDYKKHALSIMGGSSAPHAKAMTLEAIAGIDPRVSGLAIRGLEAPIDEETMAALRTAFGGRGVLKAQAAAVMAGQGDAEAVAWLVEQLDSGGFVLPAAAMAALAKTEHEESVRTRLRGLIWNKDLSIRNEGYAIISEVDQPWAVDLLLEGLDKEFGEERVGPITALGRTGNPAAAEAVRPWVDTKGLVLASLEALGNLGDPESLAAVESQLGHETPLVRAYAAAAACRLGGTAAAAPVIEALLSDEDAGVRATLAGQLGAVESSEATGWLAQLAGDAETDVRVEAYRALLGRSGPGLAEQFARGAQDENYGVASVALSGLADTGDASQVQALKPLLNSDNPYLAISAAHAVLSLADQGQA